MYNGTMSYVKEVLDSGRPVLIYNGQFDGSVWDNIGNSRCLDQMNYGGVWNTQGEVFLFFCPAVCVHVG